jgi:two-component system chemotaxis response regulator CheY
MARILVVEDDKDIRDFYVELLSGEGYDVISAHDGEDGLEKAKQGGFDLIMLDILMPKKDGVTVLEEYNRLNPKPNNKKILVLTVLANDEVIAKCIKLGAIGYMVKSELPPDKVLTLIKNYLNTE